MNPDSIGALLEHPVTRAVGWSLIHFVWQGALVGLGTFALLSGMRRRSGEARYLVACLALALMAALPAVSLTVTMQAANSVQPLADRGVAALDALDATPRASRSAPREALLGSSSPPARSIGRTIDAWIPSLVTIWLAGVLLLAARLTAAWTLLHRRLLAEQRPAGARWQAHLQDVAARMGMTRAVRIVESDGFDVPCAMGWLKPVILVPASAFAGLQPQQLEAILAHELAHVQRNDYAVNLAQSVIETLLFYHPAVWWVSRRIRLEREYCCDDRAVQVCGTSLGYARALATLEGLRQAPAALTLAATGKPLLGRIERLVGAPHSASTRGPEWFGAAAAVVVVGAVLGSVLLNADTSIRQGASGVVLQATPVASTADVPSQPATEGAGSQDRQAPPVPPPPPAPPVPPAPPSPPVVLPDPVQPPPPPPLVALPAPPAAPALPASPARPASPALPALPAVPAPPDPPAAPELGILDRVGEWVGVIGDARRNQMQVSWSDGSRRIEVRASGTMTFTDDDADVKSVSPGGYITITETDGMRHTYEVRAKADGSLERLFDGKPAGSEAKTFLARVLPALIRESALGAEARVARILKRSGPGGVLDEVALITSDYAARIYFTHMFAQATLDAATTTRAIQQAGTLIASDYERGSVLAGVANAGLPNAAARLAFADATRTMRSDYEKRRTVSALLKAGSIDASTVTAVLESVRGMTSDYELSRVLVDICRLDVVAPEALTMVVAATTTMKSDYERAKVLLAVAERGPLDDGLRKAYVDAAGRLRSEYERNRVLAALSRSAGGA